VFPEIVAQYLWYFRCNSARQYAIERGELALYAQGVREYIRKCFYLSDWHRKAYAALKDSLNIFLTTFPEVTVENYSMVMRALEVGVRTGLDWVDCLLVVEQSENDAEIVTCDEALQRELDKQSQTYPGKFAGSVGDIKGFKLE